MHLVVWRCGVSCSLGLPQQVAGASPPRAGTNVSLSALRVAVGDSGEELISSANVLSAVNQSPPSEDRSIEPVSVRKVTMPCLVGEALLTAPGFHHRAWRLAEEMILLVFYLSTIVKHSKTNPGACVGGALPGCSSNADRASVSPMRRLALISIAPVDSGGSLM